MRKSAARLAGLTALVCLSLAAQERKFAGTWEARFEGRVFLAVKVVAGAKIAGFVSTGSMTVDEQGTLVKGEPADVERESEILRASIGGDTLSFEIADGDDEPLKLELHIRRAELRFLNAPSPIKPLTLLRS